jgi:tRNA pseudouridine55 synthase
MNGVLLVDKPGGITSHDAVDALRKRVGKTRVGHAGTLDPGATGLLMILIGNATKLSRFLMGLDKEYVFTIRLGVETDTLDRWGKTVQNGDPGGIRLEHVVQASRRFKGRYQQVAPSVSALKHEGTPLYRLARQGKPVPIKSRVVRIHSLRVLDFFHPLVTMELACSSGTYVRSIARDLGRRLGCGASVFCLRRTRIGDFGIEKAVRLADIDSGEVDPGAGILDAGRALGHLARVVVAPSSVRPVSNGKQPTREDILSDDPVSPGDFVALSDETGMIFGIARFKGTGPRPYSIERIL